MKETISELIDSDAVKIDTQTSHFMGDAYTYLRLTSTRELLTDEIRDRLLENWRETILTIFSLVPNFSTECPINGLCIWQSDYGFDPHSLEFRDNHNIHGTYRPGDLGELRQTMQRG